MSDIMDSLTEIDEAYRQYRDEGRIEFVTFHPSYSYEEFIEGITVETTGEDGSPRWEKGKEPTFLIDVDKKPVETENFTTTFSYSVRGRAQKSNGYYNSKNRNEILLDTCYLKRMGENEIITDIFGIQHTCGEEEFRLSPEGAKLMQMYFGANSYVSNDSGEDVSNMA